MPDNTRRVADLIRQLLDRDYQRAVAPVVKAIAGQGLSGPLAKRLAELDAEALRLAALGKALTPDNPVVRALLSDLSDAMRGNGALVNSIAGTVQTDAYTAAGRIVRQLALPGFSDEALRAIGVAWNTPNPDVVARLIDYVGSAAFDAKLEAYTTGTVEVARQTIIKAYIDGYGPARAARVLRTAVQGLPANYAQQLLRTLQLTTLRDAQVMHRVANADILEYQIRIAALDSRTCMSCVALHGQILPIDARIDDHHMGRCTSITKVRGFDAPTVTGGPEWFTVQDESTQRQMMGNARFEAWKAGAIQWQDFPKEYTDDLFGRMVGEASLRGMLGEGAKAYYGSK